MTCQKSIVSETGLFLHSQPGPDVTLLLLLLLLLLLQQRECANERTLRLSVSGSCDILDYPTSSGIVFSTYRRYYRREFK